MNVPSMLKAAPFAASLVGCSVYGGGGGGGGGDPAPNPESDEIGGKFVVANVSQTLMNPEVDPGVTVPSDGPKPSLDVRPGDMLTVAIPFSAPAGNVVGVGVAFGPGAPVQVVSMPDTLGMASGMAQLQIQVPDSVCDDLADICHQIQCYEFAVTDIGKVSAANINQIVVACNECSEPSCQALLGMCELPPASSGCAAWAAKYNECAPEYDYKVDYCEYILQQYTDDYGPDCGAALEAHYVCLSKLSCAELMIGGCAAEEIVVDGACS